MRLTPITIKRLTNGTSQQQIADIIGVRRTMISELENNNILLPPDKMQLLLNHYDCKIEDIYPRDTLKQIIKIYKPTPAPRQHTSQQYKFTVRVDNSLINDFTLQNLASCGYKNYTDWLYKKIIEFNSELKQKRARQDSKK